MTKVEQVAEQLDQLTLLEAAQLSKLLQDKCAGSGAGVVAAMPGMAGALARGSRPPEGEDRVRPDAPGGRREEDSGHQGRAAS